MYHYLADRPGSAEKIVSINIATGAVINTNGNNGVVSESDYYLYRWICDRHSRSAAIGFWGLTLRRRHAV